MAGFYSDSHVSFDMLALLEAAGHTVVKSQAVGLRDGADHEHLWFASQEQRILLTSDTGFKLWHQAWLFWSGCWGVAAHHSGILIVPPTSRMTANAAAIAIDAFVLANTSMTDRCALLSVDGHWEAPPA
jgi:hypothetical protein